MFYIYIIQSLFTKQYYIGSCENITKRLHQHNTGKTKSLKNKGPYVIKYTEMYSTRVEAYRRKRQIKSYKGGNAFKKLIK